MQNETILGKKINGLQNLLTEISKREGISPKDILLDMCYSEEDADFILAKETQQETVNKKLREFSLDNYNTVTCEIILNVQVTYLELETLSKLPTNSSGNALIVEIGTYLDTLEEDEDKVELVEKYLNAAELIGADSILFYVAH